MAAVAAVAALVVALSGRDPAPPPAAGPEPAPAFAGAPPTGVRLADRGATVRVSWADPAQGRTSFIVSGGQPGSDLVPLARAVPGQTVLEVNGLNARLEYCFVVVAVYGTERFAGSAPVCTGPRPARPGASATD